MGKIAFEWEDLKKGKRRKRREHVLESWWGNSGEIV